jgi:hypothetical protein
MNTTIDTKPLNLLESIAFTLRFWPKYVPKQ